MYEICATDCESFEHANCLRIMLESDGFPAAAATVRMHQYPTEDVHVVLAFGESEYVKALAPIALGYSKLSNGRAAATADGAGHKVDTSRIPVDILPKLRNALLAAVTTAADLVVKSELVREVTAAPVVDHDPGDEDDTKPTHNPAGGGWESRCHEYTTPTTPVTQPIHNPPGGGWEQRCRDAQVSDPYESWKSAR